MTDQSGDIRNSLRRRKRPSASSTLSRRSWKRPSFQRAKVQIAFPVVDFLEPDILPAEDVAHVDPACLPADAAVGTDQPDLDVVGVLERRQACWERLRRGTVVGGGRVIAQGLVGALVP
ncbi:MAG: hypothetical protein ACRERD_27765 [Candidatus Binatia bacterium]